MAQASRFICYPSVVPAGKKTEITIFPRDISRRFRDDTVYEVGIIGLSDDMTHYYDKQPLDLPYRVEGGCLKLEYTFEREQRYELFFRKKGESQESLELYALESDLYSLRPLKGDLHSHSYYSDGNDGVAKVPAGYRAQGYDFFALTDHNRMYTAQWAKKQYEGVALGMHIIFGEEVHTPGSILHLVHAGGKESVCDQYVRDPDGYEKAVDEIEKNLKNVPAAYRRRIAMAHWACKKIHEAGGIAILAHPFWKPYKYNVSDEFRDLLFDQKIFDAFELMGGINAPSCNLQLALWQEQSRKGNELPVVGSSDSHNHHFENDPFGRRFTIVFAKDNTTESILDAIKKGYSVAGELPITSNDDVRFYGSLRLVSLAHFLFKYYFNHTLSLCKTEGELMQRYTEGEEVGALLSSLAPSVENFYRKFYGLTPAPVLPPRQLEYLDQLAEAQSDSGIITKGSNLHLFPGKDRRI